MSKPISKSKVEIFDEVVAILSRRVVRAVLRAKRETLLRGKMWENMMDSIRFTADLVVTQLDRDEFDFEKWDSNHGSFWASVAITRASRWPLRIESYL